MYHQRTFIYKTHPILVLYIPLKTSTQHMCFTVCDSYEACNEHNYVNSLQCNRSIEIMLL